MKNSNRHNRPSRGKGGINLRGTAPEERTFVRGDDNRRLGATDSGRSLKMHKAICSECAKECQLPFKPTGDKPVFCSNCFGGRANSSRSSRRDSAKSNFQETRGYSAICSKCGSRCEVPFRPAGGKPIYCSNCFKKGDSTRGKNTEQFKEQLDRLNTKLDTILRLLTSISSAEVIREQKFIMETEATELPNTTKQQVKRTAPSKKTVRKKVKAKKTVSSKKTMKKTVVAKKTATKKTTKKKKS
jgi:CxxC-x17-CxxC domain-containing protein